MPTSETTTPTRSRLAVSTLLKAGGGVLGALAIGAVVALLVTPVIFEDNSAASGELPLPLIEIATPDKDQACTDSGLDWEPRDKIEGVAIEVDLDEHLNAPSRWEATLVDVCVRSRTSRSTTLGIGARNLVDRETTCEASELEGGDLCDEPGDEGELSDELYVRGGGADSCVDDFYFGVPLRAIGGLLPGEVLSPTDGRTCRLTVGFFLNRPMPLETLAEIQTDQVTFDLELRASAS
jgi:hypothetical protein